jgi:hypothetical protein
MEQKETEGQAGRGLTYNMMEWIVGGIFILVGGLMIFDAYRLGIGWVDGPLPGYFPFRVGSIIVIASVVVILRALFGKKRNFKTFVTFERFKLVLAVLVPLVIYVSATELIGIYVASALFIGLFMRFIGKTAWVKCVVVSVAVAIALFYSFEIQFMIPLPKGPLEALLGY